MLFPSVFTGDQRASEVLVPLYLCIIFSGFLCTDPSHFSTTQFVFWLQQRTIEPAADKDQNVHSVRYACALRRRGSTPRSLRDAARLGHRGQAQAGTELPSITSNAASQALDYISLEALLVDSLSPPFPPRTWLPPSVTMELLR